MEEGSLRPVIAFIFFSLLSTDCIFAQRSKKNSNRGNIGQYGLVSFSRPINKDSIKVTTFVEIPFSSLQFIKRNSDFIASYSASVMLKDNKEKQLLKKVWSDSIVVDEYIYTQSKLISENIKWNLKINKKKIKALLVNTRNANAFTGKDGFKGLKILAEDLSEELTKKQNEDEDKPKKIEQDEILFACTGTIGESFPTEKIKKSIPELVKKINYTQNKYIWMKAATGILTTDLKPKLAMEECYIGKKLVKVYGIATVSYTHLTLPTKA